MKSGHPAKMDLIAAEVVFGRIPIIFVEKAPKRVQEYIEHGQREGKCSYNSPIVALIMGKPALHGKIFLSDREGSGPPL